MGIKRYIAEADNTITNAFRQNLSDRGTKGNMGQSDILEVYSIYAQQSSGSVEKSRILLKFPINKVYKDRLSDKIPKSGSTRFYLKLFNAKHSQTTPVNYSLLIAPLAQSWSEGYGIDMEEFLNEGASNWLSASDTKIPQIVHTKVLSTAISDLSNGYISLYNSVEARYNFWFKTSGGSVAPSVDGAEVGVDLTGLNANEASNPTKIATILKDTINGTGNSYGFNATRFASDTSKISIVNTQGGSAAVPFTNLGSSKLQAHIHTTGSSAAGWNSEGGDYHSDKIISHVHAPVYTTFVTGAADNVSVDITNLVEDWIVDVSSNSTFATALLKFKDQPVDAGVIEVTSHDGRKVIYEFDTSGAIANGALLSNGNTCVVSAAAATSAANFKSCVMGKNGHKGQVSAVSQYKAEITITSQPSSETLTLVDSSGVSTSLVEATDWQTGANFPESMKNLSAAVNKVAGWSSTPDANKLALISDGGASAPTMSISNPGSKSSITAVLAIDNTEIKLIQSEKGYHGNTVVNTNVPSSDIEIPASFTLGSGTPNFGVGVMLSGSYEDGSDKRSYYTKKFFARSSEFFLERPALDAVWDSSISDDRNNFYRSSRLLSSEENRHKIYLYNYAKGQLRDIPRLSSSASPTLDVRLYSSLGAKALGTHEQSTVVAKRVSPGIYVAEVEYSGSSSTIYDVWSTGSTASPGNPGGLRIDQLYTEFSTGSIQVKDVQNKVYYPDSNYLTNVTNLKSEYANDEVAIFVSTLEISAGIGTYIQKPQIRFKLML